MKKLKHTKGKWEIESNKSFFRILGKSNIKYTIADVYNVNGMEENEANAKLIAAAPDLLEACINSLSVFNSIRCTDEADIVKQLKDTIKKATL